MVLSSGGGGGVVGVRVFFLFRISTDNSYSVVERFSRRMSLRSAEQMSDTDGRSYRRAFWHNQRTRKRLEEEERKRRDDAADRRLNPTVPGLPQVVPPGKTRTNPWTDESVLDLWTNLTRKLPGIDPDGSLSLSQFVRILDVGGALIKGRFEVPFPDLPVQQLTTSDAVADSLANRNYVVKLWNLVSDQGQGKFNAESLRSYLVTPLENPLGLKVIATNARLSTLPALNLLV